jgi:hypothetical protein
MRNDLSCFEDYSSSRAAATAQNLGFARAAYWFDGLITRASFGLPLEAVTDSLATWCLTGLCANAARLTMRPCTS